MLNIENILINIGLINLCDTVKNLCHIMIIHFKLINEWRES